MTNALPEATHTELLPFTVRIVRNEEDLKKAVAIRHAAYLRHVPDLAAELASPEEADEDSLIFLAEDKTTGEPLGSLRLENNDRRPLHIEGAVKLPARFGGRRLVELTRFGVVQEALGRTVYAALVKAAYWRCAATHVDDIVIAARRPLNRLYQQLFFEELSPGHPPVNLEYASNLPHYVLTLGINEAREKWVNSTHQLLQFMGYTIHPDIVVV